MLNKGDFLNFLGIAFLAGVTIACYIAVIPVFFRKKDKVYGIFAILEVLLLLLAASGILKTGGATDDREDTSFNGLFGIQFRFRERSHKPGKDAVRAYYPFHH